MNKKGFTLIELITSFALASIIMVFVFNIVVILKNSYVGKSVRTNLTIKQSLLSKKINDDFISNNVIDYRTCDNSNRCYEFDFFDGTSKQLTISADLRTIRYDDYVYELEDSSYVDNINVQVINLNIEDNTVNDSILVVSLPIYDNKYKDLDFGINVIYQFNSKLNSYNLGSSNETTLFTFKLGDYVSMTPDKTYFETDPNMTGYETSQVINPTELNLWRVININDDGTVDMVSEYVSSTKVHFRWPNGWQNYVGYLNNIASHYGNDKYTVKTRHMGYGGQTEYIQDMSTVLSESTTALWDGTRNNNNDPIGGGDIMYRTDVELVDAIGALIAKDAVTDDDTEYLLASRYFGYTNANHFGYRIRTVNKTATSYNGLFLKCYGDGQNGICGPGWVYNKENGNGSIRPIVTLASGVIPTVGSGTKLSPYVLN